MRWSWSLINGVVWPLGAVGLHVGRFVGSNVRVAKEITRRHVDVTEHGNVVNSSQAIFRPLGVVRRFATVNNGRQGGEQMRVLRCHFLLPFSVLTHAEYVCFTKGSQSFGGLLEKTEMRAGRGGR